MSLSNLARQTLKKSSALSILSDITTPLEFNTLKSNQNYYSKDTYKNKNMKIKSHEIPLGNEIEKIYKFQDFPLESCQQLLAQDTISVIGYGPQGRGQSLNLKDNGFDVIVGLRPDGSSWKDAIHDGWIPGKNLFDIDEATSESTIIQYLLSDAGQIECWPTVEKNLQENDTLYFSHGFGVVYNDQTKIIPPKDVDVVLVAPKGPGIMLREKFLENKRINCSFAIEQDYTGKARENTLALGFGIGGNNLFETTFKKEVYSDLTGERCVLMGLIQGAFKAQYDVLREHGHSPSEAFNETVEEALISLYPMVNEHGMDWMFENCSTTAQRGALDWSRKFYQVLKPEIEHCYQSVVSGEETKVVIEANSNKDYRKGLLKELDEINDQEIWKVGKVLRQLR